MIKHRKKGDNISIVSTEYHRGDYSANDKNDYMTIVYKDLDTGLKYKEEITNPTYEYYMALPDKRTSYPRAFAKINDLERIEVPYKDLEKDIATRLKLLDWFYDNIRTKNQKDNKKIHLHPDLFNSDMNIEDHYRFRFDKLYENNSYNPTKAFFDIETDTFYLPNGFYRDGEAPINAISLILKDNKKIFVFLLRNKNNPQIEEFERGIKNKSIGNELTDFICDAVDIDNNPKYKEIKEFKISFMFYDEEDEIKLIKDFFNAINVFKPDYALAWNMAFDVPYIIQRIIKLGYDPTDIICHPDFKHKIVSYFVDNRTNDFAEKCDYAQISSYTVFIDQLIQFASIRKGRTKFTSYKLDDIGNIIAKVRKLDYKNITLDLRELPYKNYKTFVFYNIMDTIVQYCIEAVCNDIDYVCMKSLINNTRQSKVHRQTVYLSNRAIKIYYKQGLIAGNNINKFNTKPENYSGAFVADPKMITDDNKVKLYGNPIYVYNNAIDSDFSSLYPSIIRQYLIIAYNIIGKVSGDEDMNSFGEYYIYNAPLSFCVKYFKLSGYTELYHEVEEFFKHVMIPRYGLKNFSKDGNDMLSFFDNKEDINNDNIIYNLMEFDKNYVMKNNIVLYNNPPQDLMNFSHQNNNFDSLMDIRKVLYPTINKIDIGDINKLYYDRYIISDYNKRKEFINNAITNPNQQYIKSMSDL